LNQNALQDLLRLHQASLFALQKASIRYP